MASLRKRFTTETITYHKYTDNDDSKFHRPMPSSHFMGILGLMLLTFSLVIIIEKQLPKALMIADEGQHPNNFIAERSYNILQNLTNIGMY